MYSGTTFRKNSGAFIGVHQKIDRVARRKLTPLLGEAIFPDVRSILHFEGNNGPDGLKRKSPGVDEPWDFIDPTDPCDDRLIVAMTAHIHNLAHALQSQDMYRAAFEAAWLAHAVTDGLTPAHHYPLEQKIEELWGKPREQRLSIIDKNFIRGHTHRDTISKNWQYWGAKGVFSTHFLFEWGVATAVKTHTFAKLQVPDHLVSQVQQSGFVPIFRMALQGVYALNMYEEFWKRGWSTVLARQARQELVPVIIQTVVLAWYAAVIDSETQR